MDKETNTQECDFSRGGRNMKKRKGSRARRMAAVLLSAMLMLGMLADAVPASVLAQESDSENTPAPADGETEPAGEDTKPVEGTDADEQEKPEATEPAEETDPEGQKPDGGPGQATPQPDGGTGEETPESGAEEKETASVSENDAPTEIVAAPRRMMRAAEADGTGWIFEGGTLTIESQTGMSNWISSGLNNYKNDVTNVEIKGGVTSIGVNAFKGCSKLTGITIPESVASIGDEAFYGCSSLKSINIPESVTRIGSFAFDDCRSLTSINIPENVTSIENNAFNGCGKLTSINIPENVTSIGRGAFSACVELTSINISENVTSIGDYAFLGCSKLTEVNMQGKTPPTVSDNTFKGCGFVTEGTQGIHVPDADTYKNATDKGWGTWAQYIADSTHTHSWSSDWTKNESHHWHECTAQGCTVTDDTDKDGYGAHVYDNDSDTCNTCGYKMTVAQTYAVTVQNGTGGGEYAEGATVKITANAPESGKQFDKWVVNSGSVTLADATSSTTTFTMPARAVSVTATYKDIEEGHTHNYGDWQHDSTQHWKVCSCGDEIERGNHNYGDWVTDKEATATEAGTKHRDCQTCQYRETESIPATGGGKPGGSKPGGGNSGSSGGNSGSDDSGNGGDNGGNPGDNSGSGSSGGSNNGDGGTGATAGKPGASGTGKPRVKQEKEGNIQKEVSVTGESTLDAAMVTPLSSLADIVLTETEKQQAAAGTDIKIVLDVKDATASVSAADKKIVETALNGSLAKGYTLGQYLDISLYKVVGNSRNSITNTNGKLTVTIDVPDSLKNTDSTKTRTFAVIRVHDGRAVLLTDLDNVEDTITIETDRFSTYAIVYKDSAGRGNSADAGAVRVSVKNDSSPNGVRVSDKNGGNKKPGGRKDDEPDTGDHTPIELGATLSMIAGLTYLLLYFADRRRGMTEETKRELVSRLIAWAKQGGRIRKCLALAAIFVLLVYYHSVGKKTCVGWEEIKFS